MSRSWITRVLAGGGKAIPARPPGRGACGVSAAYSDPPPGIPRPGPPRESSPRESTMTDSAKAGTTGAVADPAAASASATGDGPTDPTGTPRRDLSAILRPRSVAVIGASDRAGTIGAEITRNLVLQGFRGPVFPVRPNSRSVQSILAYGDVREIPGPVDLAIVVVRKELVRSVVEACAEKGVRGVVVITAGFKETGPEGLAEERELAAICRAHGMALVGPNCLGVVTTDPDTRLDATFAPTFPPAGNVAVASQSGALGVAMLDYARELNIGVSDFVSMGNKADVSGNDLIAWWADDPRTRVILLYLESFGNPQRFASLAREVARHKPIVAVKSGRSRRGNLAASSHTGSLAGAEVAVEALVEETGIIRVDTVEELFDMAAFLAHQPVPRGRRVGILTNAGGPGILATDAAEAWGLQVPDLPDSLRRELATFLPAAASLRNPVDMIASATPDDFRRATTLMLGCDELDAVIVLFVPPIITNPAEVGEAIAAAAAGSDKPVISCFMGRHGVPEGLTTLQAAHIPSYAFPESAVRVLARAARYGEHQRRDPGTVPDLPDLDLAAACRIIDQAPEGWLGTARVGELLDALGIHGPGGGVARSAGEAAELARALGFPVVLKLVSDTISHKSDVGGVKVDLRNETDVFEAWEQIRAALAERGRAEAMQGVLVQPMVSGGVECLVGVSRDPVYGPLLAFGLGGVHVELLKDVRFRIPPLTDRAAAELVRSVAGFPLLDGYRGAPKADVAALEQLLIRVGALAAACPELVEMDLNPVIALPVGKGVVAVDARVRVAHPASPPRAT
ncbi:MAG: CoA-binding protein [Deltaproteobacteria bacterium]|nr:MAG: CoA-binding protein [Deltaproteobacteria bacterium]